MNNESAAPWCGIDTTFAEGPNAPGFLLIIRGFAELQASDWALFHMKSLPYDDDEDAGKPEKFKSLSAEEARELRERNPSVPPWKVVLGQGVVGLMVALAAWIITGSQSVGWSAAYGALAVVLPAALFARGLTGRFASLNAGTAVLGFFLWEMVKIVLTVAMLIAAPRLVVALSWPALLVGLVLTMKVYWVALVFAPRNRQQKVG
jgi:ATP synthase protein I